MEVRRGRIGPELYSKRALLGELSSEFGSGNYLDCIMGKFGNGLKKRALGRHISHPWQLSQGGRFLKRQAATSQVIEAGDYKSSTPSPTSSSPPRSPPLSSSSTASSNSGPANSSP